MNAKVEYWHTHDTRCSLREYLGMTVKEYELWLKDGDSALSDILQGRRKSTTRRAAWVAEFSQKHK